MSEERPTLGWREWFFLASVGLVCVSVASILSTDFRAFVQHPAVYGWASAVGTFAAVATALWVSLSDARLRRAERKRAVDVFRWPLGADLSRVVSTVQSIDQIMALLQKLNPGQQIPVDVRQRLTMLMGRIDALSWGSHIDQLVYFDTSIAQGIALVMGTLPTYVFNVRGISREHQMNQAVGESVAFIRSTSKDILLAAKRTKWID